MPRYSVTINWSDSDRDQGTFGWTGIAADEAEAERMTREAMSACDSFGDDGDESSSESVGGSVVEITTGAIWRAQELEDALRGLLAQVDATAARVWWSDNGEREAARKLLADLDKED